MQIPKNVECAPIASLIPAANNPRTHSKKQISQIAASIQEFGFTNPVLVDKDLNIIAGHGRVAAAKQLKMKEVPILRIEHMSETQRRAYIIADNQLALRAGWDEGILAIELQALGDLNFDLELTGFDMGDIDRIVGALGADDEPDEAETLEPATGPAITQAGDIWQIGPHRLICGDALEPDTYDRLMDGAGADMVFTDPPYNVKIDGHVSGLGKNKHREFAMASGEMSAGEFEAFLTKAFTQLARVSRPGAIHYVCMDWRHTGEVIAAGQDIYTEIKNICVWVKANGGMGSLYRSRHEFVFVFKAGNGAHSNNVELGKHGRYRTNVWEYAGANSFGETRDEDLAMHPTVKPVDLVKDAILDCSKRGGIILDGFAGSGTTLLAAHQVGRKGYGIEIDPAYCDVILTRLMKVGLDPVRVGSGEAFRDLHAAVEACHDG
ncbi:MAG: ParB N-terminal domain-containing protein [Gammaproteobacteria bacterium]|nr:ParB N-terminal domain-containing protein [Gammaproteobacteria bacterium]